MRTTATGLLLACLVGLSAIGAQSLDGAQSGGQQVAPVGVGSFSALDARRRRLIEGWVARFNETSGLSVAPGPFYDEKVRVSARTTFEAVTHALMTTPLTNEAGTGLGDALDLIERVDAVKGQVQGASSDHQFRMYVTLKSTALATLEQSQQFRRGADNTVFHQGYPMSFRARGGTPSIQVSIALDGRQADIDVDYRGSAFPVSLFNGHLTSANSDVRAGNNYDRHVNRWSGFDNWWRGFFGIRLDKAPEEPRAGDRGLIPATPRAGKKNVDVMARDFLQAWLVEGNIVEAMGYVSERAYACLALDAEDPASFDRGMAPFQLMNTLKAAKDALGPRSSLDSVVVGVRLTNPELKTITQPHHAQFVAYSVPDDVAAKFDCASRLNVGGARQVSRAYGTYSGTVFYIAGREGALARTGHTIAVLWAREGGYWKIVSWQSEPEEDDLPAPAVPSTGAPAPRIKAEPDLAQAARDFLERWLIQRDFDGAYRYLAPSSYDCYNLTRGPDRPPAGSPDEAARAIRAGLERAVEGIGRPRNIDAVVAAVDPSHPAIRLMDHPHARTFALVSVPNAFADADSCAARGRDARFSPTADYQSGRAYAMLLRFRTESGEAPVLRVLWLKDGDAWRIAAYQVVMP